MGKSIMFLRVLLTALALAAVAAASFITDCEFGFFGVFGEDPVGVCSALPFAGELRVWLGVGLGALGALGVVALWVRPLPRRGPEVVEETLVQNLARIPDLSMDPVEVGATSHEHMVSLGSRFEAVMVTLEGEGDGSRDATAQWIGLLREANELHNLGELTTEDFKTINTRLLGLLSTSGDSSLGVSSPSR